MKTTYLISLDFEQLLTISCLLAVEISKLEALTGSEEKEYFAREIEKLRSAKKQFNTNRIEKE